MKTIRTIVIDDEKEARDGISLLLQKSEGIELLDTCENGLEAIRAIENLKPDLIFLDIQMPKINGFEVLNSLQPESIPKVIFVTAYDQYALRAFEVHASDYLLKPFSDTRFFEALAHVRAEFDNQNKNQEGLQKIITDYLQQADVQEVERLITNTTQPSPSQLIVKTNGKIIFIPLKEITHIVAQNYYVNVHTIKESYLVRESLKSLEVHLKGTSFLRIHRSVMVNSDFVKEVEPYFNGELIVRLKNDEKLKVSRSYKKNLPKILG